MIDHINNILHFEQEKLNKSLCFIIYEYSLYTDKELKQNHLKDLNDLKIRYDGERNILQQLYKIKKDEWNKYLLKSNKYKFYFNKVMKTLEQQTKELYYKCNDDIKYYDIYKVEKYYNAYINEYVWY